MNQHGESAARRRVATLGPDGTDAHAEALRLFDDVVLADSFESAMNVAFEGGMYALVATGFVERSGAAVSDLWVNLHFRHLGRMRIVGTWESPTKPMCVAAGPEVADLGALRSIALHPATDMFAERFAPQADRQYVDAKPLAVQQVVDGAADGCIGSLDVVERYRGLTVREVFRPTMVWVLYQPAGQGELPLYEPPRTMPNRC
ncbi:hypothetical protein [Streptomyces gardneri]|uniref:hypothetical protein n=1 Tax=Streptomyces gardneri TaxID=66892 RepID=UPI00340746DA